MRRARARTGPSRSSLRSRVAWLATLITGAWVVALAVGANLLVATALARTADTSLRARAEAVASTVGTASSGALSVREPPGDAALDVGTWIISAAGAVVERPPVSDAATQAQVLRLTRSSGGPGSHDLAGARQVRLFVLPVERDHRWVASVVTSTSLLPFQQLRRQALVASAAAALGILVVVHLVLRFSVSTALRPVHEMGRQVEEWSTGNVERRLDTGAGPTELTDLAGTLNSLLDRIDAVLRHERLLTAELSHELRTPLAVVAAEVDWLRARPRSAGDVDASLTAIDGSVAGAREVMDAFVASARAQTSAPGRCDVTAVLTGLAEQARRARPALSVAVSAPGHLSAGVEGALLARMVAPLLDNALRYAEGHVTLQASMAGSRVEVLVEDDGPGVAAHDVARILSPGYRGNPQDGHDGAGLGLALVARLARTTGGDLVVTASTGGGRFRLQLPAG